MSENIKDYPTTLPIYVHCLDWSSFLDYQKQHSSRTCVMIEDDVTLRGRIPGIIARYGDFSNHPYHQAIEESIDRYEQEWKAFIQTKIEQSQIDEDFNEYGV